MFYYHFFWPVSVIIIVFGVIVYEFYNQVYIFLDMSHVFDIDGSVLEGVSVVMIY